MKKGLVSPSSQAELEEAHVQCAPVRTGVQNVNDVHFYHATRPREDL